MPLPSGVGIFPKLEVALAPGYNFQSNVTLKMLGRLYL